MKRIININEIFTSINGEVNRWMQGSPTIFIRLQGCNLLCDYCDTKYARSQNDRNPMTIERLLIEIQMLGIKRITITGGEPLLQKNIFRLITELAYMGYQISIETNGSLEIPRNWITGHRVCWIVDYKFDFVDQMILDNYYNLTQHDWIKFVIKDRNDFEAAISTKNSLQGYGCEAQFAFSPMAADPVLANEMVFWLTNRKIDDVILNLQLHGCCVPDVKSDGTCPREVI